MTDEWYEKPNSDSTTPLNTTEVGLRIPLDGEEQPAEENDPLDWPEEWAPIGDGVKLLVEGESSGPVGQEDEPNQVDVGTAALAFIEERRFTDGLHHLLFLTLVGSIGVAIILLQLNVPQAYDVDQALISAFQLESGILTIDSRDGIITYLHDVWAPVVFGQRLEGEPALNTPTTPLQPTTEYVVLEQNKVATTPIISQQRYKTAPCGGVKTGLNCLETWSGDPFGSTGQYTASSDDQLKFEFVFRMNSNSRTHTPSAAVDVLSLADAQRAIQQINTTGWIDSSTAFIRISCHIYNPHYRLIAFLRIIFVQTRSGRIIPFARIHEEHWLYHRGSTLSITRLSLYGSATDYIRGGLEGVFIFFTAVASVAMVRQARFSYQWTGSAFAFGNPSTDSGRENLLNGLLLLLAFSSVSAYGYYVIKHAADDFSAAVLLPETFETGSRTFYFVSTAILLVVFAFKFLSSIGFNPPWRFLTSTLSFASKELANFMVIFLSLLWFYAFTGYYYFGHNLAPFRGIFRGLESLLQFAAFGETEADVVALSQPAADASGGTFPTLFYWSFMLLVVLIMINMFLAIILRAYDRAKSEGTVPVPQRSWQKRTTRPVGGYMLKLFQHNEWVDMVIYHYFLATCRFHFSNRELILRIKRVGPIAQDVHCFYVIIPASWGPRTYCPQGTWSFRKGGGLWPVKTECKLVLADLRRPNSPVIFCVLCPDVPWYDHEITITLGLETDDILLVTDKVNVYWTESCSLAVGSGISLRKRLPVVPKRAIVSSQELLDSPKQPDAPQPPKRCDWPDLVNYCKKAFPA